MAEATLHETIAYCGKNQVLMEMTYNGVQRLVEPYSYREKSTGTLLYAYCYKDEKIESFRVDRIERVKATTTHFEPRYEIEF